MIKISDAAILATPISSRYLPKIFPKLPAIHLPFIQAHKLPEGDVWSDEAKPDGYRCLAAKSANDVILWSCRGNGFVHLRRQVFQKFKGLTTNKCPFANLPEKRRTMWALTTDEMKHRRWLKPLLIAQVEFTEWTRMLTCAMLVLLD